MSLRSKSGRRTGRSVRRKEKWTCPKEFVDDDNDDEIEGRWSFDLDEKLASSKYDDVNKCYIELNGADVTLSYFQKNGFTTPILVREKTGLGMRIPSENFTVHDVQRCVGSRRVLDVMDVWSQKGLEMTVKEWVKYYENKAEHEDRLLNVISLEFSHTRLEDYVDQPRVVHEMDWIDTAWPWYYKELQTQSTNALDGMMYPKVQKYCLMSVGGCYTDFHIDMGGTSVWYHILRGRKVFWLIEPTDQNLSLYVGWTLSTKQNDIFFGDLVETCHRVTLEAGSTFFIPTGWIHAVYTPEDSLVFGGNFLHSYSMTMQLCSYDIEARTHVPVKFRYPFFRELHWYVLERYVSCLTGKQHRMRSEREIKAENGEVVDYNEDVKTADSSSLKTSASFDSAGQHLGADTLQNNDMSLGMVCDDDDITMSTNETIASSYTRAARVCGSGQPALAAFAGYDVVSKSDILKSHGSTTAPSGGQLANHNSRGFSSAVHLTPYEIEGLTSVVNWLKDLPVSRRNVPKDIPDPEQLLRDVKELLDEHRHDDHAKAVTGLPVLQWPRRKQPKRAKLKTSGSSGSKRLSSTSSSNVTGKVKRHRVRCNKCEPCTREDCRECVYCLDMEKYGGPRKLKKPCISRNCLGPKLPRDTICQICGGGDTQHDWPGDDDGIDWTSWLMECRICFEVVHPNCLRHSEPEVKHHGVIDEDLPSSWDCARCCEQGLEGSSRPRSHAYSRVHQHRQQQQSPAKSQNSPSPGKCRSEKVDMKQSVSGGANGSDDTCKLLTDRAQPFVQLATLDVKKLKLDMSTVSRSNSKQTTSGSKSAYVNKPLQSTIAVSSSSANKVTKPTGNIAASVASSTTQEFHEYDFLSPRVSSRGREITVPRRYLL